MADIPIVDEIGDWVTTKKATEITGMTIDYMRKLVMRGLVKAQRWENRSLMISKTSLEQYVASKPKPGRPKKQRDG